MTSQCESCIHRKVCCNFHIMKQIIKTIDAAIDHIEVTIEDKACSVKDLPWIKLDKIAIACADYQASSAYRNAMNMAQTCRNAVSNIF